jgi:hypothetical protein
LGSKNTTSRRFQQNTFHRWQNDTIEPGPPHRRQQRQQVLLAYPAQTNSSSEPSSTSGLNTGAKIGLGIGTGVGTIALAVLGAFIILRKRRKTTEHQEDHEISDIGIPELEDRDEVLSSKKWYLFGKWRNEMPSWSHRHELDPKGIHVVNQVPVELEASENPQELEPHGIDGVQAREDQD